MNRRRVLHGAAGLAAGFLAGGPARAQDVVRGQVTVAYDDPGPPIADDFIGLSYESAVLAGGDYFSPDNASVLGLIRTLGLSGVIRIGGNTSERTVWQAEPGAAAPGDPVLPDNPARPDSIILTPASIDRLAASLRALGWKLIYGLNLARGTPQGAAAEAAYVAQAVGANLLAFQIGNEPDGFGSWTGVRPKTYDAKAFLAEWHPFHAAIRARVPDARFAGPDVAAATDWIAALAEEHPAGLALLTRHYYADGPAGAPAISLAKLLRSDGQFAPMLERLAQYGRDYRLPVRIVETNSIYGEGQPGVSDTLGAALWGLELAFQIAAAGAAGINFHAGVHNLRPADDKAYTPIARSQGGRYRAMPLYYGMLLFSQAARGVLVEVGLSREGDLKAFAARAPDGGLRVCVINKEFSRTARVRIDPGRRFAGASVMRLLGPAMDATTGVTLGGMSVDEFGAWAPAADEPAQFADRAIIVDVPAASAALVSMRM
jgi:hypothetical protein